MQFLAVIGAIAGALCLYFAFLCLGAWVFQLLWNWVMVGFFHAQYLDFWYSVGIVLILSLIGSFFKGSSGSK